MTAPRILVLEGPDTPKDALSYLLTIKGGQRVIKTSSADEAIAAHKKASDTRDPTNFVAIDTRFVSADEAIKLFDYFQTNGISVGFVLVEDGSLESRQKLAIALIHAPAPLSVEQRPRRGSHGRAVMDHGIPNVA